MSNILLCHALWFLLTKDYVGSNGVHKLERKQIAERERKQIAGRDRSVFRGRRPRPGFSDSFSSVGN